MSIYGYLVFHSWVTVTSYLMFSLLLRCYLFFARKNTSGRLQPDRLRSLPQKVADNPLGAASIPHVKIVMSICGYLVFHSWVTVTSHLLFSLLLHCYLFFARKNTSGRLQPDRSRLLPQEVADNPLGAASTSKHLLHFGHSKAAPSSRVINHGPCNPHSVTGCSLFRRSGERR